MKWSLYINGNASHAITLEVFFISITCKKDTHDLLKNKRKHNTNLQTFILKYRINVNT